MQRPLIVIEHLEDHASRWLMAEYEHAYTITGHTLIVTNAREYCNAISRIVGRDHCFRESILDLEGVIYSSPRNVVILDLRAAEPLTPAHARAAEVLVIGGILGDYPPRGRTWEKLTKAALLKGMQAANLGPKQFSIDGAVYVASRVAQGTRLDDVSIVEKPVVEIDIGDGFIREVELPFAYPVVNGRPLLSPKLKTLLQAGLSYEEYVLLNRGSGAQEEA